MVGGTMTVAELRAAIRAHGFEADTDAQQLTFLNEGQRDLARGARLRWTKASTTVAITAGTADFTLPAAPVGGKLTSIRLAYPTAPTMLAWADPEHLLDLRDSDTTPRSATPAYWAITAPTTISLWPTPGGAGTLTVRYHRVPPALAVDADTPILPELYHDHLVEYAAWKMAARERQWDAATRFQADYEAGKKSMRAQEGITQQQTALTIGSSGFYADTDYA